MARVLAISSQVVRGHVGLAATVPALQWLGHEVWALPKRAPGEPAGPRPLAATRAAATELAAMLAALEAEARPT